MKKIVVHNNNEMISDMAIVVVSYDGYSDLWDDYFNLLNKYWADRPYAVYLVNNTKQPNYQNVTVINCGANAQWSTRTRIALEHIKEKYICLLLEDYFTGAKIENETISEVMELIRHDDLRYYKLNNFSEVKTKSYKKLEYLLTIPEDLEYGISLQPAIWTRDYLLDLLGAGDYNAWKFELDRIKESSLGSDVDMLGCIYDKRNVLQICHGVAKGKYLPPAIKYFEKQNYHLNTSQRDVMTQREYTVFRIKGLGKQFLPKGARKITKKILRNLGMNFTS